MQTKLKLYTEDKEALCAIRLLIEANPAEMYSLDKLCMKSGLNRDKLNKGFRLLFGFSIYQFHVTIKMSEAKKLLSDTSDPVSQIAYMLGYEFVSSFCNEFKKFSGETPAGCRNKMQDHLFVAI